MKVRDSPFEIQRLKSLYFAKDTEKYALSHFKQTFLCCTLLHCNFLPKGLPLRGFTVCFGFLLHPWVLYCDQFAGVDGWVDILINLVYRFPGKLFDLMHSS
ncbi:unnamed protein product [Owenia fusiformis]|uniref:Uncharacterized protein n=1 Tax=Owenia fusiformis TaxID=6347 RepID=A0A8S4NQN2_OWEFU|nr:unnamed protein product [Owenia fusiformis]